MDKKLSLLIISALLLTGVVAILGIGLLIVLKSPKTFVQQANSSALTESSLAETSQNLELDKVVDGIDATSGFIAQGDYQLVKTHCTACHSSKLVIQNRATREGWLEMIRWMQETQKLWDLQPNEDKILDYLATHYAPINEGRRRPLQVDEWYVIE